MEISALNYFTTTGKADAKRRHLKAASHVMLAFVAMAVIVVLPACRQTLKDRSPMQGRHLPAPTFVPNAEGYAAGMTLGEGTVTANGQSNYVIPVITLVGRGKIQPDLALRYESSTPNGIIGVGWSLRGLSTISRC